MILFKKKEKKIRFHWCIIRKIWLQNGKLY